MRSHFQKKLFVAGTVGLALLFLVSENRQLFFGRQCGCEFVATALLVSFGTLAVYQYRQILSVVDQQFFIGFLGIYSPRLYGSIDAIGMFSGLAGFALAQGAALTVVARGEGRDVVVLTIYGIAACFTFFWSRALLFALKAPGISVYSFVTHEFGTWTICWQFILGLTLLVLGWLELLPNQKSRLYYPGLSIECHSVNMSDHKHDGMPSGLNRIGNRDLTIYEANSVFSDNYQEFRLTIHVPGISIQRPAAFLESKNLNGAGWIYREIAVSDGPKIEGSTAYDVSLAPDKNERLIFLTRTTLPASVRPENLPLKLTLRPHFGSR